MKHNLLKSVIISVILLMGVSNAWAWWFVPGSWNDWDSKEANSGGVAQMNGSNTITFYNVPAGNYEMKLIKGSTWGNGNYTNKSGSYISSVSKATKNGNDEIKLSKACDLTFTITDENNWNCDVSASDPTHYIKYNWNGSGWAWSGALTAGNNYSCTGQYGGSASFDHTRKSSTDESGTNAMGTTVNSPTTGDKCVFTYNTSTKALTITRCNKVTANSKIYFDNSLTNWSNSNIYFVVGHDKPTAYSKVYKMNAVNNTKLFYAEISDTWEDATYYAFVGVDNEWNNGEWGSSNLTSATKYTKAYTAKYDLGTNGCYYITPSTGNNNTAFTITYKESYNNIPKLTATQSAKIRNSITDQQYTIVTGTWPATLKLEGTHLTGFGKDKSARLTISSTTSGSNVDYDAVVTGKITHSYTNIGSYVFDGWGTSTTPSNTSSTYDYNITAATTVYAFFTKAVTMTFTPKGEYGSSTVSGTATGSNSITKSITSGAKVAVGSTINLTANPATGYQVEGWYSDANCTQLLQKGGNTYNAGVLSAARTVYVKFEELSANTVYLKLTGNWKSAAARYAVYVYINNTENEWIDMEVVGCSDDYYKVNIPARYTNIIFGRMDPKQSENSFDYNTKKVIWNQTTHYNIQDNVNKCFTVGEDQWGNSEIKATGTWDTYNPTITLTLKSSTNGIYRVRNNGNTYVSSLTEDVVVELPINTEINIAEEGAHVPNHGYKLKQCFIQIGNNEKEEATIETKKYGLCGSTTISANFVTEEANTVYFKPNANWTSDNAEFAVYLYDEAGEDTWINLTQDAGGYYTCVIPEEWSNLRFVRLNPNGSGLNWDSDWNQTYSHHIPVTRYNAYTLHADKWGQDENEGWWSQPEATNGDYRLLYVEQVVEKEDWKTVINRTKQHPSDIIKKRSAAGSDIASLHIYTQGDNPEVILQQYNGSKWVDIEAHMVNGPLEALPGTAMLPGRKNASPDSDIDDFVYDDGIEVIKTDDEDAGCGVWNFTIVQDGSTATLDLTADGLKRYEGKYYIRTDASAGGWSSYTIPANYMTFSSYSKTHSDFSHYYCQWILQGTNVKFTIANDYGYAISDTLDGDSFVPKDGVNVGLLSEDANIRFSWNQVNNNIYRAYIKGAYNPSTHERLENIVATYKTESGAANKEVILDDSGNWIYQKNITDVKVGSSLESLIAEYRDVEQIFEENIPMLTGGDSETYTVRILYDFKIDKTLVTLVPNDKEANISIDVLIERVNQGEANQVKAGINAARTQEGSTVYAVMSFTQDHIESSKTEWERLYYWVSFPFDVRISEVFGFGEYGEHWIMQYYDGEERAAKGCWIDSPTYWRFITDTTGNDWTNGVLKANKGYVLALTTDIADLNIFQHTDKVSLYFPSTTLISNINADVINTTVELEPYTCTIERNNRYLYDSNWHIIGIPSYANKNQALKQSDLFYFYTYETANNTYSVTTADPRDSEETVGNNVTFKSMHSYMVQYAGTINWQETWVLGAKGLAAKTSDSEDQTHSLRLELQQSNTLADKTFIKLQDKAGITDEFDLNIDLTKIINSGANIYTLAGKELIQLAGNVLPIEETIIPIGIQLDAAGEYTFAMPAGTDGIVVELIDYQANTTTNLLFNDYTVSLPKGTFDNRFALSVKPDKTATSVENISNEVIGDKAKKYIIDGVLYMQKDGVLYDAQGHIVR